MRANNQSIHILYEDQRGLWSRYKRREILYKRPSDSIIYGLYCWESKYNFFFVPVVVKLSQDHLFVKENLTVEHSSTQFCPRKFLLPRAYYSVQVEIWFYLLWSCGSHLDGWSVPLQNLLIWITLGNYPRSLISEFCEKYQQSNGKKTKSRSIVFSFSFFMF